MLVNVGYISHDVFQLYHHMIVDLPYYPQFMSVHRDNWVIFHDLQLGVHQISFADAILATDDHIKVIICIYIYIYTLIIYICI